MAYVGTRTLFEDAGFSWPPTTEATSAGFPRVVMRGSLTAVRHDAPALRQSVRERFAATVCQVTQWTMRGVRREDERG